MKNDLDRKIKIEEWYGVILSFIYYFCVLGSYYIMRPLRDQLAAEVGSAQLPGFFAATFIVMLLLTPLFAWLVSRWPRRVIMPVVNLFFIACQLLFIPLFGHQAWLSAQSFGLIFFVWVSVFNLFVVSVFWSFMTDIWSDAQARRLFPIIALGGTLGAVVGPMITRTLVEVIRLPLLLAVSAGLLLIAVLCVIILGNWAHQFGFHRNEVASEAAVGGGMLDGLKQIFTNPFIGYMALMMLLNDAIGTVAYALITDYSGAAFPNDAVAQTRFASNMDLSSNIIQVVVQLTTTRWLLVSYGAGAVFAIWTVIVVCACLIMVLVNPYAPIFGTMPYLALVLILTRALVHGMIQPARETLYTLVPRDLRYKGKNAVDTVVWRAGDVLSLLSINGFRALGVNVAGFGLIWAGLAAASGWLGWRLANQAEKGYFEK
ncbi:MULTISPECIES: NTP/NDP exchange transporter [Parachlamydia]|uniref:NTP/NDP exchange transporter n=1 Tax=Parachlamydia TaxID=83551 RepID=UPI0001C1751C|nr:MFS transporter [Parachlamydia acanthamoebae]EFB40981.1 ADP/ATP translocase [Parachlamydia acanthamoebae str. Hall's coccus]